MATVAQVTKSGRRLAPILSLDAVGYTRLMQHDEKATLAAIKTLFDDRVAVAIGEAGGTIFNRMGDGILAEFSSVIAAIEWTASLLRQMHEQPIPVPGGETLSARAGIILADMMVDGEDRYGEGVNLVARVQEVAPPGGLAISKWMYEYLVGKVDLSFTDIGSQSLKNIAKTIRIFIWHPDANVQHGFASSRASSVAKDMTHDYRPSLAVLPFNNMSGDPNQDYFADAVTEEITATLSRAAGFLVIARNSAFAYKGRAVDVRRVGRELGVRYVVEGSVMRLGDRIRITSQLVETVTGHHIWSDKAEGALADLFELQDRIAEKVAGAVYPSVRKAEIDRAQMKRADNLEAYDFIMRSLPHLWAHRMHENPQAIRFLEQALAIDPHYGIAAALCAWAHAQQIVYNWSADIAGERAKGLALIETAARYTTSDATALTALGTAVMLLEGNPTRALSFIDRALMIDSNHAWAWTRKGFGLIYVGRPEEALECFSRSGRLSPLDPFIFNMRIGIGLAHFAAGRPQEAMRYPRMVLDERPGMTWPYRDLAVYRAWSGDLAGARDALEQFVFERPPMTLQSMADSLRFMQEPLLNKYIEGLRRAGWGECEVLPRP